MDKDWKSGDSISIYGWDTSSSSQVGISVNLQDYFNWYQFDTWHKISIPLVDMELNSSTLDAIRIKQIADEGKAPRYYLDDIQFEAKPATGTLDGQPLTYSIIPDKQTWLHVSQLHLLIADDDYNSNNASGTIASIPYNSLLGVASLDVGINYQRIQDNEIKESFNLKEISHLVRLPGTSIVSSGSATDGTHTWMVIQVIFNTPIILKSEDNDKLQFTISDNLSGLDELTMSCHAKIEYRY